MFFPAHLVSGRRVLIRHTSRLICLTAIALESAVTAAAAQPSAQPMPEAALLALAKKKFGTLSRAEEELFRAAQQGRAASALDADENENDPDNAANWPAHRAVRAACIAWLCTAPQASLLMTYRGLEFHGMRIDGVLDLANAEIKFELRAWKCAFSENIGLQHAQLRGFYLLRCRLRDLKASGAIFTGSMFLRDVEAKGEVSFKGAAIGGDLDCEGAHFSNQGGTALTANGTKIEGSVFLNDGFKAKGEVDLSFATIRGNLECDGAEFSNSEGPAFNANTANIEGSVYLRDGFRAEGTVNLVAARIGNLQIRDVIAPERMILDLRLTKVRIFWDDEASWPSAENLFLGGFRYEHLYEKAPFEADSRKKWLGLQSRDKFRPQPYEQLAAVLREMGHERDARQVMIEKNRERANFTHFPRQGWWWYNVFGRFIGYGYEPWRAFAASVVMTLLGTLLFGIGFKHDLIGPTSENAYMKEPDGQLIEKNGHPTISERYPVFNAFVFSFESFVPLLKLDQSASWRPNANRRSAILFFRRRVPYSGSFLRGYLYFHITVGWLLTSLWVGAITGLVKT